MAIEVELPDGSIAEFPEGMPQEEIQQAIAGFIGSVVETPPDMPVLPPTGAERKPTEPKGALERFAGEIPALVGGIAGPLAVSGKAAQMAPAAGRALQVGAAAVGGAAGEAYKTLYQYVTDNEEAPQTSLEASERIAKAGGEQALYEIGGQAVIKGLQQLAKPFRPTIEASTKALGQEFQKFGGAFTIPQMAENNWIKTVGGLVEKSFTGSPFFKKAAERNRLALDAMGEDLATKVTGVVTKDLTDKQLGQLFLDTAGKGRVAHSSAANSLYKELDNLIGERELTNTITRMQQTGLVDVAGNPIEKAVQDTVTVLKDNAPVDMRPMKKAAQGIIERMERTGAIGGKEAKEILNTVSTRPDKMLFSDANVLRSDLLSVSREMEEKLGAGKAKKIAGDFASMSTEAMMKAAKDSGDPALLEAYQRANKFWAHGKEIFDNKFIGKLITQNRVNAEKIGESVFRDGNVTEILQAKKAVRAAAKLDKDVNADEVWRNMQSGYLNSLLAKSTDPGEEMVRHQALNRLFLDPKKSRTLSAVFDAKQRNSIKAFQQIAKRIEQRPESQLSMVMQLSQAGTLGGLMAFKVIDPTTAATMTIGPAIISRMLTNPKTSKTLLSAMSVRRNTTLGQQLATKLIAEATQQAITNGAIQQQEQEQ
jgi:hypothetical protein